MSEKSGNEKDQSIDFFETPSPKKRTMKKKEGS